MMGRIGLQIGLAGLLGLCVLAGLGLLVGAAVVALQPLAGLAGALAIVGLGFFGLALAIVLILRAQARAASQRRSAALSLAVLAELALLFLPRKRLQRLEAEVAAGVGLAALIAALLRPASTKDN